MRRLIGPVVLVVVIALFGPPLAARLFGWGADPSLRPKPGRFVEIGDGLQLNVTDLGQGEPVVLVHGLPSCASDWAELPSVLAARGYRVIAYDRIGYGYSSRSAATPGRYTLESNAGDLKGLLDALGIQRAALVGWSYGGGVAQVLAQRAPERVSRLVLVASVGPAQPQGNNALNILLQSPVAAPILKWVASVPPLSRAMTQESVADAFSGGNAVPPGWTEYTQAMLSLPGTLDSFALEERRASFAAMRPQALAVPVLILQGSSDRLVPPLVAEDLHQKLPKSSLVMIPDGSHMLPVTHAQVLADQIDSFLRSRT